MNTCGVGRNHGSFTCVWEGTKINVYVCVCMGEGTRN